MTQGWTLHRVEFEHQSKSRRPREREDLEVINGGAIELQDE